RPGAGRRARRFRLLRVDGLRESRRRQPPVPGRGRAAGRRRRRIRHSDLGRYRREHERSSAHRRPHRPGRGVGGGAVGGRRGRLRLAGDGGSPDFEPGVYRITFATGTYFAARGAASFYPEVTITFEITGRDEHYHVPLLLSPYAYSTYRGS